MKVLVIHASAGAGHMMAARAIYNRLEKTEGISPILKDALDLTHPVFKTLYRKTYSLMITHVPTLWAVAFAVLDIPLLQPAVRGFRRCYNALNAGQLEKYLIKENFDCVISCHFLPTEVSAALKRKGKISSRLITVITDYDVHRIWLAKGIDMFTVASDWTKESIQKKGIAQDNIHVTGIPTDEKFCEQPDLIQLKQKLGLKPDIFTVLIATGSFGIGPIEKIIERLKDFQVIVICGHNQGLYNRLSAKNYTSVKVCPLVDNMHELMAVSDVMVTKPGGLSISEALVKQLPLIFFNPIPGQEQNNIKVLKTYGIGLSDCSIDEIVEELQEFKSSKDKFLQAVKRTRSLARPNAAADIVSLIS